jgi:hypothetical protein
MRYIRGSVYALTYVLILLGSAQAQSVITIGETPVLSPGDGSNIAHDGGSFHNFYNFTASTRPIMKITHISDVVMGCSWRYPAAAPMRQHSGSDKQAQGNVDVAPRHQQSTKLSFRLQLRIKDGWGSSEELWP